MADDASSWLGSTPNLSPPDATAEEIKARTWGAPIADLQAADPYAFRAGAELEIFKRLRREAPVHRQEHHEFGPYWSVTRYDDIMAVDTDHASFSSEPTITIVDQRSDFHMPMFIAMDPPKHDAQRKTVQPIVSGPNLAALEPLIRERAAAILDSLPLGEEIDWVDKVSIELTAMTLATLFGIPQEDRRKLTYWSDVAVAGPEAGLYQDPDNWEAERQGILMGCVGYFLQEWEKRLASGPGGDLISMLAHGESTRNMDRMEYLGNLILLIVGGNDTTRNTITGSILALNQNPDQYDLLKSRPDLIPGMVSETIRWQTPLAHMRRNATRDVEIGGQSIKQGDKVIMWYVSGNRDEAKLQDPDRYWVERPDVRRHLSFGFGIHRCVGNRLAELQLKIIWEEILKRFSHVEVTGEPSRTLSSFVRGYTRLPVRLHAH